MIQFNNLMDGLCCVERCPLCGWLLDRFAGSNIDTYTYGGSGRWSDITIRADRNRIRVELLTGVIMEITQDETEHTEIGDPITMVISKPSFPLPTSGLYYTSVHKNCTNCNRYHLTLQIQFDMSQRRVHNVLLNSERIFFYDKGQLFEITNVYVMDKTEFSRVSNDTLMPDKKMELPLIPLDRNDAQAYISRVKNLLIFS